MFLKDENKSVLLHLTLTEPLCSLVFPFESKPYFSQLISETIGMQFYTDIRDIYKYTLISVTKNIPNITAEVIHYLFSSFNFFFQD